MGGEQADDENYCRARNDRRGAVEPPDDNAGDRAGYRRAGVDVLTNMYGFSPARTSRNTPPPTPVMTPTNTIRNAPRPVETL